MIFISHANPEDNSAALWLATKLAAAGYPVWCDVINLVGGEFFWDDIESAIRNDATKVIALISTSSVLKPGVKDEINCAVQTERRKKLRDFLIPCRLDEIPFDDIGIQVARRNVVDFREWGKGLEVLLLKLSKDGVPRSESVTADLVCRTWTHLYGSHSGVSVQDTVYDTNSVRILELPETIWANDESAPGLGDFFPSTASSFNGRRLSFQSRKPKSTLFGQDPEFSSPISRPVLAFLQEGWTELGIDAARARHVVTELLNKAWSRHMYNLNFGVYNLSGFRSIFYFNRDLLPTGEVPCQLPGRKRSKRNLWGLLTKKLRDGSKENRYYHVALECRIENDILDGWRMLMLTHIVWTNDGLNATFNQDEQHSFRKSMCRNWWNDRWRGFLHASLVWLRSEDGRISVAVGSGQRMAIDGTPSPVISPIKHTLISEEPGGGEHEE